MPILWTDQHTAERQSRLRALQPRPIRFDRIGLILAVFLVGFIAGGALRIIILRCSEGFP